TTGTSSSTKSAKPSTSGASDCERSSRASPRLGLCLTNAPDLPILSVCRSTAHWRTTMKTYALKRAGKVVRTTTARDIDEALDSFFPGITVDVDLDTLTERHMDVQPVRRGMHRHVIEELVQ